MIELITERIRECARKINNKQKLTLEEIIFTKNVLFEYADVLDRKARGGSGVQKSDDIDKIKHREKVLKSRILKRYKKLTETE